MPTYTEENHGKFQWWCPKARFETLGIPIIDLTSATAGQNLSKEDCIVFFFRMYCLDETSPNCTTITQFLKLSKEILLQIIRMFQSYVSGFVIIFEKITFYVDLVFQYCCLITWLKEADNKQICFLHFVSSLCLYFIIKKGLHPLVVSWKKRISGRTCFL